MTTEDPNTTDINDYNYSKLRLLKKPIFHLYDEALLCTKELDNMTATKLASKYKELKLGKTADWITMQFEEIEELYEAIKATRKSSGGDVIYMCDIMRHSVLELPKPSPIVRSRKLESRLERLRIHAENSEYRAMTKNVGAGKFVTQEPIAKELKVLDSQIMFMFNFLLTVLAAFAFGYKATEYALPQPDLAIQLIVGMVLAMVVFVADIYFVIRDIDKDDGKLKRS